MTDNQLGAARARIVGALQSISGSEENSGENPAIFGNDRLRSVINAHTKLVRHSWPARQRDFSRKARAAIDERQTAIDAANQHLNETNQHLDNQIARLGYDRRNAAGKLTETFKLKDIASGSSVHDTNLFHVIGSPRFGSLWYWIGIIVLIVSWIIANFTFAVVAALAAIGGYALFLVHQAQTCWRQIAALEVEEEHAAAKRRAEKKEAEAKAAVAFAAANAAFKEKRDVLAADWKELRDQLTYELLGIDFDLEETLAASAGRLDAFSNEDPLRDDIKDLETQLEFRIGEYDPLPPAMLPSDLAKALDIDPMVPQLGSRFPVLFSLSRRKALMIHADNKPANTASITALENLMTRILRQVPPGKATFTLFDPLGLGSNFSPYLKLQEFSDKLIDGTVWTSREQIKRQLENIITHIEGVNKLYLKADYPDIEAFNRDAKEIREPYRFLVISDFPEGFTEDSVRDLVRIVQNGPRCGVHTLIYWNKTGKEFYGFEPAELSKFAMHLHEQPNGQVQLEWAGSNGGTAHQSLYLDPPPSREHIKAVVDAFGEDAVDAMTVEVPFERLYELSGYSQQWWELSSAKDISVPIGPVGANDALRFRFDSKLSNNALIVGRPGSGKSNLMHVFISMVAHKYSPEQIELYLIDFKKGVEFKDYASAGLPHARVIAVESEREFGLSVLEALDKEMLRRSEVFKASDGVEGLAQYRELHPEAEMPRCVLLIDEFQELFSREDKIKDEASILLDRIVRQGRSFGVHVILGTQSLHNAGLMRSTTDQIPIRIALQCSDADSRAILADDNVEARSLSRPGEAIYNDMGGLVEGNKRFQVALFGNSDRKAFLKRQSGALEKMGWSGPHPRVFEGHEPASLADCEAIRKFAPVAPKSSVPIWIGEPVSLDPPISMDFSAQAGRNMLVVSREEKSSVHVMLACIASLAARLTPRDLRVQIIDLSTADAAWADDPERLEAAYSGHRIEVGGKLDLKHVLPELCETLEHRKEAASSPDGGWPREVLAIVGAHRARNLRRTSGGGFGLDGDDAADAAPDLAQMLSQLAEEGPEYGIHTMLWVDSMGSFEKIFEHGALENFALRIAGTLPDRDSHTLFESNAATAIDKPNRMVAYDDDLVGVIKLFRPYAIPDEEFFDRLVQQQVASNTEEYA